MEWQILVALVIAIPIILIPVAFVWYLNIGGLYHAFQAARQRRKATQPSMLQVETENDSK